MPLKISTLTIIVVAILLQGCSTVNTNQRVEILESSLNEFRKSMRWGYIDNASSLIKIKNNKQTLRDQSYLKGIRITSYEYINKAFTEENHTEVIAEINYYHVDRGVVKNSRVKQEWWFDVEQKRWFLDGDLPDLTGALPQ